MADQQNRGGKKQGNTAPQGQSDAHQGVHEYDETKPQDKEGLAERPAPGQPGGPKQNIGKTRSTD